MIQICPSCKKETNTKGIFCRCENKKCKMKTLDWFSIDFWNTLRVAPDDKPLHSDSNAGYFSWMDPDYTKGE